MWRIMLMAMLVAGSAAAMAQDEESNLDRIEVTGSRLTYDDLVDTPAISITRRGDYLLQEIELVNDSRDEDLRRSELHQTIAALVAASDGRYEVLHGDTYRVELTAANHKVELETDSKRPDTAMITLYLRAPVGAETSRADEAIRALRAFATDGRKAGRTEIDLEGDAALGMNRPERYRYELIDAIAQDAQRVTDAMKLDCQISIEGLNSRLEWQRVSAAELLLYIPYTMLIEQCSKRGAAPAAG
jgi:hypothetical protein